MKTKWFVLFSKIMLFVSHDPSWLLTGDVLFCALLQHHLLLYSLLHLLLVTISSWIVVSHDGLVMHLPDISFPSSLHCLCRPSKHILGVTPTPGLKERLDICQQENSWQECKQHIGFLTGSGYRPPKNNRKKIDGISGNGMQCLA